MKTLVKPATKHNFLPHIGMALLLLACLNTASAESFGRLFFSPQDRARLDYDFAHNSTAYGNSSPVLTVNGIIQKQGGSRTVWINGVAQDANRIERNPTAQTVRIPGKSQSIKLKVGDKILLDQTPPAQTAPSE